jgi:hypothetical protein
VAGELLFQYKGTERDHTYYGLPEHDGVIRESTAIFKKDNHVYSIYSQLHTGLNQHSGKRYFRWQRCNTRGIRLNSNSTIVAYHYIPKVGYVAPSDVWRLLDSNFGVYTDHNEIFQKAIKDTFGISSWLDVYPVAKHYGIESYYDIPYGTHGFFRAQSSREFVEKAYGKRQYRKDLLKAVGESNASLIWLSRAFRGLVPIDWIINFLRNNVNIDVNFQETFIDLHSDPRNILVNIDPRSYRHLLNQRVNAQTFYSLNDMPRFIRDLTQIDGGVYRDWRELHDRNMRVRFSYERTVEEQEIELIPLAKKIHGLTTKTFEIRTATHTKEMIAWGEAMHNCIAGYRSRAAAGKGIYGGVYQNGKLVANFEIVGKRLCQLLGPCNQVIPAPKRKEIEHFLNWKGVNVENYWGKHDHN